MLESNFTAAWYQTFRRMKKLLEQLNAILIGEQEQRPLELRELKITFEKKDREILRSIKLCKKSGGVIGIYSPVLGNGMTLCSVLQIHHDKTLALQPIDPNGNIVSKILLDLSEVTCICPFNQIYTQPEHEEAEIPSQLNMFQSVN